MDTKFATSVTVTCRSSTSIFIQLCDPLQYCGTSWPRLTRYKLEYNAAAGINSPYSTVTQWAAAQMEAIWKQNILQNFATPGLDQSNMTLHPIRFNTRLIRDALIKANDSTIAHFNACVALILV